MSSNDERDPEDRPSTDLTDSLTLQTTSNQANGAASSTGAQQPKPSRDHLTREQYFMFLASLSAQRSKDPVTQVGACIVNERDQIVGLGYNGMPNGCPDDDMPWEKNNWDPLKNKGMYVCHAELNAIINKNTADVRGCTIYVSLFPCNECAKLIIQAGITQIVYYSDKRRKKSYTKASKKLLNLTGVKERIFNCSGLLKLTLDLKGEIPNAGGNPEEPPSKKIRTGSFRTSDQVLSWKDYFMAVSFLSARCTEDPLPQVGACIVNPAQRIVAVGYPCMPCGYPEKNMHNLSEDAKKHHVCHAELNAIMNKNCVDLLGCTMHVTQFPCNECAKLIIQAGLKEVVYAEDGSNGVFTVGATAILTRAGVTLTKFGPRTQISIDLESING